jgi:hypothetical protein
VRPARRWSGIRRWTTASTRRFASFTMTPPGLLWPARSCVGSGRHLPRSPCAWSTWARRRCRGFAAKPILDLQLSVAAIEPRARYVEPLERLGYLFVPAPESPDYHFFAKPPERPRTHHLHVCECGSEHEFRHLAVRDLLRTHDDEAARYAAMKRQVVARHPRDRLAYIEGKDEYIAALEARAVEWARGHA